MTRFIEKADLNRDLRSVSTKRVHDVCKINYHGMEDINKSIHAYSSELSKERGEYYESQASGKSIVRSSRKLHEKNRSKSRGKGREKEGENARRIEERDTYIPK